MKFEFVERKLDGEVAILCINDPPANTLTYDLVLQLEQVFFELHLDNQIKAVVISGAGDRFFSGGVNIGMLRSVSAHYNSNFLLYACEVFEFIQSLPMLVVAAINGHVTGGGLELALLADRRVAVDKTYNFGFPEVRLGVIPGLGGTQRLSRLVGEQKALEHIVFGEFISVGRAKELGIVDEIFPQERFMDLAVDYTRDHLAKRPNASISTDRASVAWSAPSDGLVRYERQDAVGLITMTEGCAEVTGLQALWALNQAIISARADEGVEVILLSHEGEALHIGRPDAIDQTTRNYAQYVFSRLEGFPRLCVIHFQGGFGELETELALACDFRFTSAGVDSDGTLLTLNPASKRAQRYRSPLDGHDIFANEKISCREALEIGLVRKNKDGLAGLLSWASRFVPPVGASKAIGYAKFAVVQGGQISPEAGGIIERHLQEQLFRGHDGPEGMQAYLEKRAAKFVGE